MLDVALGASVGEVLVHLTLVRHPRPVLERPGVCYGHLDVPGSEVSPTDLAALAKLGKGKSVVSSDLRRCHSLWPDPLHERRLRELNFGSWEGHTWPEIEANWPHDYAAFMNDFVHARPTHGECFVELHARVGAWMSDLEPNADVLVLGHSGVIRSLLCRALGLPLELAFRFQLDYLSVTAIAFPSDGVPAVEYVNRALS